MFTLYAHAIDREVRRLKFQAQIHGAEIQGEEKTEKKQKVSGDFTQPTTTLFQHPSAYEHLTQEEREELTRKMIGFHRQAMRNTSLGR